MLQSSKSIVFLGSLTFLMVIFITSAWAVVDISEIPLDAQTKAAPATIMFVLDDSGSMDWEVMTEESNGLLNYSSISYEYVFDSPGDHVYNNSNGNILPDSARKYWKSQWFNHNKMYYNPAVTYEPWPTRPDANPNTPNSHPIDGHPFDLSTSYLAVTSKTGGTFNIPRAHYYVLSKTSSAPYLVTIDGSIKYYSTAVSGSGTTESVTTYTAVATPPSDVLSSRDYAPERQNFANWYSFYRRRELTATAAVSNVISQMAGVQIGISTLHQRIEQPALRVKVGGVDNTNSLIATLYNDYTSGSGTPLADALYDIGEYYKGNTTRIGTCPYWSAATGGECQQAFAILMTDGYYNSGTPAVGNVDGNNGVPFADTHHNTLADVAMKYWENDLSTSLDNLIIPSKADPAVYQHMVTYGVSFGVTGTLNPASYDLSASTPPYIPWPDPEENEDTAIPEKIDDLYHASVNGHGTFLNAADPMELVNSLLAIMLNIKQRIGSASSVSVNGDQFYKLIDDKTYMFQASYNTNGWLGDIKTFKVATSGAIDLSTPVWSAAEKWADISSNGSYTWSSYWDSRPIATYNGSKGVPFRLGSLTVAQKKLLDPITPATTPIAQDILDYIRGKDTKEQLQGGSLRNRSSRLGDIVHSSPIYHNGVIYVGANDGMMHAIIAEGTAAGKELFSYVPSQIIKKLPQFADPDYKHNYYVDKTVTVRNNVLTADSTLLVGGLGQGGKGYYALDISKLTTYDTTTKLWSPSSIDEATVADDVVLWEFPKATTTAYHDDIGYSFSDPLIIRTNSTAYPWVVVFGNGYNSKNGDSVLFVLNPLNGNVLSRIKLGSGADNGLSTPAVTDVDGDGRIDYIYAGDLVGNMWKIDLTGHFVSSWAVAFNDGSSAPLFRASGPTGTVQPITSKPDVMYHPQHDGYLVAFGTGKFLGKSDFSDTSKQTVYGIWDYGDDADDKENLGTFTRPLNKQVSTLSSHSTLLEQELLTPDFIYDPGGANEQTVRVLTDNPIKWETETDSVSGQLDNPSTTEDNNVGWYFDLPNSGERIVSQMIIRDGKTIFISFTPENAPCTPGGNSILHEINAANGGRLNKPVFDMNGDGIINASDMISVKDKNGTVITDSAGNALMVAVSGIQREGQLQPPAIMKIPGTNLEQKVMTTSASTKLEIIIEPSVRRGPISWREF